MTTSTSMDRRRRRGVTFWATPATSVALGIAMGAAAWAGGDPAFGAFALVLMTGLAVAFVLAARYSETVRGILDRRDERIAAVDRDASLVAGMAVIGAVLVAFIVQLARGADPAPFSWLGAIGGASYVAAVIVLRLRR